MFKTSATVTLQHDSCFSPFNAREFADSLAWLSGNGFSGAEISVADPRPVDVASLKKLLVTFRLEVPAIATGQARSLESLSLTDPDPQVRRRAVARVKAYVDLAESLRCPLVSIGLLRGLGWPDRPEKDALLLAETMDECAAYAGGCGVMLAIEPVNRYETLLLNNVRDTLAFIARLANRRHVGILFDTFHANIEEPDLGGSLELANDKLLHVHFADSNRWLPGDGHIDFAAVYRSLRRLGYRGYVSLETLMKPDGEYIKAKGHARLTRYMNAD